MIIQVVIPGIQLARRAGIPSMPQNAVHNFSHRQNHSTQLDEVLSDLIGPTLDLTAYLPVVEEVILKILHLVVEGLHRLKVAIDDDVKQAMHQSPDAMLEQISIVVPAADDPLHIEVGTLAYGDQSLREDERRHPRGPETGAVSRGSLAGFGAQPRGVGGEKV